MSGSKERVIKALDGRMLRMWMWMWLSLSSSLRINFDAGHNDDGGACALVLNLLRCRR